MIRKFGVRKSAIYHCTSYKYSKKEGLGKTTVKEGLGKTTVKEGLGKATEAATVLMYYG
jgi:hypothetical protein